MNHLTLDHLLALHDLATDRRPADERVVNARALGYCVLRPQEAREGREVFLAPAAKGAALLQAIVATQPFVDGNQRTAWVACRTFLLMNGYRLAGVPDEVSKLLRRVKSGEVVHAGLQEWIEARMEPIEETPA